MPKRKILLITAAAILAAAAVIFYFWFFKTGWPWNGKIPEQVSESQKTVPANGGASANALGIQLELVKLFPHFGGWPLVYPDPQDVSIVWLADNGGILEWNMREGRLGKKFLVADGAISSVVSMVRADNALVLSDGADKLQKIEISAGRFKTFSLLSSSEAISDLVVDPDGISVWWASPIGLVRFDARKETLTEIASPQDNNYFEAISVNDAIVAVRATEKCIWVARRGNVMCYNKTNGNWKEWGAEFFEPDDYGQIVFTDFDADGALAAVVSSRGAVYQYDSGADKWNMIMPADRSIWRQGVILSANRLYFLERQLLQNVARELKYVDFSLPETGPQNTGISGYDEILAGAGGQIVLLRGNNHLDLAVWKPGNISETRHFLVLPQDFVFNALLAADNQGALLSSVAGSASSEKADLWIYDIVKDSLRKIENWAADLEEETYGMRSVADSIVIAAVAPCKRESGVTGCPDANLGILKNGAVYDIVSTPPKYFRAGIFIGATVNDIFAAGADGMRRWDQVSGSWEKSEKTLAKLRVDKNISRIYPPESSGFPNELMNFGVAASPDGDFRVEVDISETPIGIGTIRILEAGGTWVSDDISFPTTVLSGIAFDPIFPRRVWIGTDNGLVVYDAEKRTSTLFTGNDIPGGGDIAALYRRGDFLYLEQGSGIYIFRVKQ